MGNYSSSCQAIAFQLQSFTHCLSVFEQLGRVLLYECTACRPVLSKTWPRHIFFLSCGQISEGTSPTCSEGCYFLSPGQNGNSSHMIWHQSIQTGIQIEMFRPILYVYFCRCIHDISMQIFLTPIASTNYTSIARVGNNNCLAHASGSKCWPFKCMYRKKT